MQGFSAAFSTGERPVWESPIYRDLVLGNAFNAGNEKAPSKPGVKQLADSLGLLTAQLYVMSNSNTLAPALKPVIGRVHAAFSRSMEACRALPQVTDQQSFYEMLSSFVAKVRAMQPGSVLIVPGGWKNGLVCFVLINAYCFLRLLRTDTARIQPSPEPGSTRTRKGRGFRRDDDVVRDNEPKPHCEAATYCLLSNLTSGSRYPTLRVLFKVVHES